MSTIRFRAGKWQVQWREPKRDDFGVPTGSYKQCGESFDTEAEAISHQAKVEEALAALRDPSVQRKLALQTVGEYAQAYFEGLTGTIDLDTIAKYRANYLLYVAPSLGAAPVASVRVADVKRLRSTLASTVSKRTGRNLSAATIKHAMSVLRCVLDVAVENEAITSNPAAVRLPSLRRQRDFAEGKKYTRLSVEDIAAVAEWIATESRSTSTDKRGRTHFHVKPANPVYALAVLFSAATGVRRGELQGLEIRDLTLSDIPGTAGSVTVARAKLAPIYEPRPLKTENAYRTIPLDSWLADDLRVYLADTHRGVEDPTAPLFPGRLSRSAAKAEGRNPSESGECFDWTRPIEESMVYKRYWLPALAALGLSHSRWHDMRHSFAVASLQGEHYRDVSRWLGHSKVSTTLDIYAAVIASEDTVKQAPTSRPVPRKALVLDGKAVSNVLPIQRKLSGSSSPADRRLACRLTPRPAPAVGLRVALGALIAPMLTEC